ncbi:MAG TPA: hypothetical protein VE172_00485 [Stackebrandtia sp.]|uniref:hypothetical protein n=1 Tax=Stackebrandtia sp. TaxID=2023065 RepID=UPI002D2E6E4B|nr:hypothetical protein [Stackebrandtia sp.]HZE37265.1 hypothetical protein [Stackebrandtia sp.]
MEASLHPGYHGRHRLRAIELGLSPVFSALPRLARGLIHRPLHPLRAGNGERTGLPAAFWRGIAGAGGTAVLGLGLLGLAPATVPEPATSNTSQLAAEGHADSGARSDRSSDRSSQRDDPPAANHAKRKHRPRPVHGLSHAQMNNAIRIVNAGEDLRVSRRGQAVALMTAMQESKLRNLASTAISESQGYANEGLGSDFDSVGLFQQRPSMGWGTVKQCMTADYSAKTFYRSLKKVGGWTSMPLGNAAQTVQGSAFPDAYGQWQDLAWDVIREINR